LSRGSLYIAPMRAAFPATRHSALAAIRSGDAGERRRGLEIIAEAYWRPVYSYLRLQWKRSHDDAADLTQQFFEELVEKEWIARFDPRRARLRTFLRSCADGIAKNDLRASRRVKRTFDFDQLRADLEAQQSPARTPEELFEQEWARGLFSAAVARLEEQCRREGKEQQFEIFKLYDLQPDRPSYAGLAKRFRIAVTDVTNRLAWVRRQLRANVLALLRESTADESELRSEARALFGVEP
jgi:RNA polymerase sigma factor (sigma-70 family)